MPEGRPPIPSPLERELRMEAGYRCAICRAVGPLVIDHIEDWAKVREHKFDNMIVLCANCHGLKGNRRGQIDRTALRQYKANLALLNHRYGDFERRILDYFAANPKPNFILLPGGMELLFHYLVSDGYLEHLTAFEPAFASSYTLFDNLGNELKIDIPSQVAYRMTESGLEFVRKVQEAKPLELPENKDFQPPSPKPQLRHTGGRIGTAPTVSPLPERPRDLPLYDRALNLSASYEVALSPASMGRSAHPSQESSYLPPQQDSHRSMLLSHA
jgi:hypothetical protein